MRKTADTSKGLRAGSDADAGAGAGAGAASAPAWSAPTRVTAAAVAMLLAMSLVPFAGCAPASVDEGAAKGDAPAQGPMGVSDDAGGKADVSVVDYSPSSYLAPQQKWVSFDDGSSVLSVGEAQVHANADAQRITVKVEGATLASEVKPSDIELTGGLAEWQVGSVERVSDTELAVDVQRPAGVSPFGNGASIAGVGLRAACVSPDEIDTSALDEQMEKASDPDAFAEQANSADEPAVPEGATVEEEDFVIEEEGEGVDPVEAALAEFDVEVVCTVSVPFVVPFMAVDVADTELREGEVAYRLVAADFVFPENLSVDDFSIELADAAPAGASVPELKSVKRLGDFEIEAVVTGDALAQESALDYAAIVLFAQANETGGDVAGSLVVPEAWVDARVTSGSDADVVTIDATLRNSDADLTAENVTVNAIAADGSVQRIDGVSVAQDGDGSATIEVSREAVESQGNVVAIGVDVGAVSHASGGEADPTPYVVAMAPASGSASQAMGSASAAASVASSFAGPTLAWADEAAGAAAASGASSLLSRIDLAGTAFSATKSMLGSLAGAAWSKARTTILADTFLGDRSNVDIYNKVVEMSKQMSDLSVHLKQLNDEVTANYCATIVNDANMIMSNVQSDYSLLLGLYGNVLGAKDDAARAVAIDAIMTTKRSAVDALIKDLNALYTKLTCADAKTGAGLITVYDNMAAKSYNWAGDAAAPRTAYRSALGDVWGTCTALLYVVCGADAYKAEYEPALNALQDKTVKVNALISSSDIPATEYQRSYEATVKKADGSSATETRTAYYCYTTGEWYRVYKGSDSPDGWTKAFFSTRKHGKLYDYRATNPFTTWDSALGKNQVWGSLYMDSSQAAQLVTRSTATRSLQAELRSFAGDVPKYFVVGSRFDMTAGKMWHNNNDWYFDTYEETASNEASAHRPDMLHFNGDSYQKTFGKRLKEAMDITPLDELFVLEKVKVKAS